MSTVTPEGELGDLLPASEPLTEASPDEAAAASSELIIEASGAEETATMQAAPRHSASPRIEAIAAWLIAALILAGGGIVARLIVDYPQFLPNSYIGFLIYRAGPAATLLWACAGATITVSAAPRRPVLLIALVGSIAACFALSGL